MERYSEGFSNRHVVALLFENSVLKEVRILRYLHNNSTMLIQKFKNKLAKFRQVLLFFDFVL